MLTTLYSKNHMPIIIDGALATEMEARGADLHDVLWSAKYLHEAPELIEAVHRDYLDAGARIIITASYQASIPGFMARGMTRNQAVTVIARSVQLAKQARDAWRVRRAHVEYEPLIAGSVGPYGAYTADGGEYRGRYGLSFSQLKDFHRPRLEILCNEGVDLIACETIPDLDEAIALAELLTEFPGMTAWMSFSCPNDQHTWAGQSLEDVAKAMNQYAHIHAIGSNCTAPEHMVGIINTFRKHTQKHVVVYPNSGEIYNADDNQWYGSATCDDYVAAARTWVEAGATIIGGCCRTTPATIAALVAAFPE